MNVASGNHSIAALHLNDPTTFHVIPSASTLTLGISSAGGNAITKTGAGTLQVNRLISGGVTVSQGKIAVGSNWPSGPSSRTARSPCSIVPGRSAQCSASKPASERLLKRLGLSLDDIDVIELNEAFAAQGLAVLRQLGLTDDDPRVNPNGGAIALGHPLGMSGARLLLTATEELHRIGGRYALCTMCIGVGQGIATVIERA